MNPIGSYNTERLYWGWELKTLVKDDSQDFWPEQLEGWSYISLSWRRQKGQAVGRMKSSVEEM